MGNRSEGSWGKCGVMMRASGNKGRGRGDGEDWLEGEASGGHGLARLMDQAWKGCMWWMAGPIHWGED